MNQQAKVRPAAIMDAAAMNEAVKESLDTMTHAFANWLRNANRMQAEAIGFMQQRFEKDLRAMARFGECRKAEEFAQVNSELITQMVNDYMEEGVKLITIFGDLVQSAVKDPPASDTKH